MMLNGGELDGTRVLSRKTVESMLSDHLGGIPFRPGQGFGLGFSITHDPAAAGLPGSAGEFGWGGAYHSTYWADPKEEMVVVYLTQIIPAIGPRRSAEGAVAGLPGDRRLTAADATWRPRGSTGASGAAPGAPSAKAGDENHLAMCRARRPQDAGRR